jgi:mercuric ion binding protein
MRYTLILFLILVGYTSFAQKTIEDRSIKVDFACDHCLKCESCGPRIEKAIYTEKGIKRVEIDQKTQMVRVVFNSTKTSEQAIKQAIANAGFDAGEVKANPEAYSKLDDCCKK